MTLVSGDLWVRQLVESLKEISVFHERFELTRELEYLDKADESYEQLVKTYELESISFLESVEMGRGLRARQAPY